MTTSIVPPAPRSRGRVALLVDQDRGNGIDYVEVDPVDHTRLAVGFVRDLPPGDPWDLVAHPDRIRIRGGERVRGIRVESVARAGNRTLDVVVDRPGDFSPYEMVIEVADLDPVLHRVTFSFMAACPSDLDCRPRCDNEAGWPADPRLDTLAKDYESFRRMLLDLMAQRHPSMSDHHPADLSVTILELLAFHGDQLSYEQDAVASEAYLETARRRISVRRHTRLVDYVLHEGRNAFAAVHVAVNAPITLPTGTRVLTRVGGSLPGAGAVGAGPAIPTTAVTAETLGVQPLAGAVVFETSHSVAASPLANVLHVHPWGEDEHWLAPGATTAWLWAEDPAAPTTAALPVVGPGDRLVLEQVRSPRTGAPADADLSARWVVRVRGVRAGSDPAYRAVYERTADGEVALQERTDDAQPALPLLGVAWDAGDAPDKPVCVRAIRDDGEAIPDVTLARGNIVLADHGTTYHDVDVTPPDWTPDRPAGPRTGSLARPLRLRLDGDGAEATAPLTWNPLTFQVGTPWTERRSLKGRPEHAVPAVRVAVHPASGPVERFAAVVPDLLDSPPDAREIAVEVDDTGHGVVRFGDGVHGRFPLDARTFTATFRVGNGVAGNVGAESLVHVVVRPEDAAKIVGLRNPLAAFGGVDPETEEHARQVAPERYKSRQERAVTESDAVTAVLRAPEVRAAVAALRWTGSWYTWLVSVLPSDPEDLVDTGGTHQQLSASLRRAVVSAMDVVRLAGHDIDVRAPRFVAVELGLHVCAEQSQSRSVLRHAVRNAVLGRRSGGPLSRDSVTFGRPLELGDVYAAVAGVPGVASVKATLLRRLEQPDNGELAAGRLDVAPWEVLRLDDDPNRPGRGVLHLDVDGGRP